MKDRFDAWNPPIIEEGKLTKWNWMVQGKENLNLGKKTDIGALCYINARFGVEIQDEVQIGSHCSIYSESTIDCKKGKITLKRNCRIGTHSTIMPGVTIGENSIIGAHSFVNKDIPDNVVAFGTPVRVVKKIREENPDITTKQKSIGPNSWKVPLFRTYSDQHDIDSVTEVLKRGTFWATGPEIDEFEKKIIKLVGTKYALSFSSGTSALLTLLLACDVKGHEVIIPSFTFIATANAVVLAGGIPVFAECEPDTFGLDVEDVRKKIGPRTKAVIPVHYGGCAARDTVEIVKLCVENNLLFLDDAAESLGASINGKKIGTFGDAAMFSLCQNKVISCGEGGIVVTDDQRIYEKIKLLRSHGRFDLSDSDYFSSTQDADYLEAGYNFRMSTISAALGFSQLDKLDRVVAIRKKMAEFLNQELSGCREIKCPFPPPPHEHLYQMYTITLPDQATRYALQNFLREKGIMTKVYFNPVHLKTLYQTKFGYKENDLPITENLSKKVLTLPMSAAINLEEYNYVVRSVKEFFKKIGEQNDSFE